LIKYVYFSTYEGEVIINILALLVSISSNFDSIPSPQLVGDSFCVAIYATDSSSFFCSLSVEPADYHLEICGENDNIINFTHGTWQGWVKILSAADSLNLCCSDLESKDFSLSNKFKVTEKVTLSQLRQAATSDSIYIYPNPLRTEHNATNIDYYLSEDAHISIMIFDKFGNLVWNTETDETGGARSAEWDGTDNNDNRVFSGVYIVCIKATNQTQTVAQYAGKIAVIR